MGSCWDGKCLASASWWQLCRETLRIAIPKRLQCVLWRSDAELEQEVILVLEHRQVWWLFCKPIRAIWLMVVDVGSDSRRPDTLYPVMSLQGPGPAL